MLLLRYWPVCLSSLILIVAGCEGSGLPAGAKPTKPVTVTVTYNGAAVEGATVSFICDPPAFGRTDANGQAKMKTYVEGDGAIVGSHKATVTKAEAAPDTSADVSTEAYAPPDPDAPPAAVKSLIPEKYSLLTTSDLTAEVKDSGPNEVKLELKD